MTEYRKTPTTQDKHADKSSLPAGFVYRWDRIMHMPPNTQFHDLSTGKRYLREQFIPLHKDHNQTLVETFLIKATEEEIHVPSLRLLGDKMTCSLMKKEGNPHAYHWEAVSYGTR